MASARILRSCQIGFRQFVRSYSTEHAASASPGSFITAASAGNIPPEASSQIRSISFHSSEVNGGEIHYAKTGTGNHTLLLLPGAIGSSLIDFEFQLENINKDLFTLIAWDPRGYGKSKDTPRDWVAHFLERDAHDAAKLMSNLKINKYSLLGWSDGAITALLMAAYYPDNIRKCISLAGNAYVTKDEVEFYQKLSDINQWSDRMRKPFAEIYGEARFQEIWREWIDSFTKYYTENEGNICKHILPEVKCPTLVVQGKKDPIVPAFHADYLAKEIPNARLVHFDDGKHNLHFKYAKEFNSLVEHFLLEK